MTSFSIGKSKSNLERSQSMQELSTILNPTVSYLRPQPYDRIDQELKSGGDLDDVEVS